MNCLMSKRWKSQIARTIFFVMALTLVAPTFSMIIGFEDNGVVTAAVYDASVSKAVYDVSDLATKAAKNNKNLYENGTPVDGEYGNFGGDDIYILRQAEVDVASWVYGGTSMEEKVIQLADEIIENPHKKKLDWQDNEVNAYTSEKIAHQYLAMKGLGQSENTKALLDILIDRQSSSQNGSFDNNGFSDIAALEALGRGGDIDKIDTQKAVDYILNQQNTATGGWTSGWQDFKVTAQAVRALIYLKNDVSNQDKVDQAIAKGVDWIKGKQQKDGSFNNGGWDDPVINTSEAMHTLKLLEEDLNAWKRNGRGPVDYIKNDALNNDGTFGTSKNISDNTWALDAYLMLGGIVNITGDGGNNGGGGNQPVEGSTVAISIKGYKGTILSKTEVKLQKDDTVFTVTKRTLDSKEISYSVKSGDYFVSIDGQAEKDKGEKSGWLFNVNGSTTSSGSDAVVLYGGEEIAWFYTLDYTSDPRNTNVSGDIPIEEIAEQIESAQNILDNENAKESEITKAVREIVEAFDQKINQINSQEDAKNFVKNVKKVVSLIEQAQERIKTEEGAKELANQSINIIKILEKSLDKLKEDKKEAVQVATDVMAMVLASMDQVIDIEAMGNIAEDIIKLTGNFVKNTEEDLKEMKQKAIKAAEQVIEKAGTQRLTKSQLKQQENKIIAKIDSVVLDSLGKGIERTIKAMKTQLEAIGLEVPKDLVGRWTIEILNMDKEAVEVSLDMKKMQKKNEIKKLEIHTDWAVFYVTPDTFWKEEEIRLRAKKVDRNTLSALVKNNVPEDSLIVDLDARIEAEKISSFQEPMIVSIPYNGEVKNKEKVEVFLLQNDGTITSMGGEYDREKGMVTFKTSHFSKYFAKIVDKKSQPLFTDLQNYAWAKEAVEDMARKGIIHGRKEEIFDPGALITRAEFATLATKVLAYDDARDVPFIDVAKDAWYYDAIAGAYHNRLISGRSETVFDPEGNITRQEMAVMIGKALRKKGYTDTELKELEIFNDTDEIAAWAKESVALCVKESMMRGIGNEIFAPTEKANRAQAAVILYKLYQRIM
ncbi:S-layer homology domain-containing protein [Clostridiaceae bacterium 35-E11]